MVDEYATDILLPFSNAVQALTSEKIVELFRDWDPSQIAGDFEIELQSYFHPDLNEAMARDVLVKAKSQVATDDDAVHFKCVNLEASIREDLKKPEGTITRQDLAALKELLADNGITDLTGLAYATNLTALTLDDNEIGDVAPLARLNNLTKLWLHNNHITDVSPLEGLINLTDLWLNGNEITANVTKKVGIRP